MSIDLTAIQDFIKDGTDVNELSEALNNAFSTQARTEIDAVVKKKNAILGEKKALQQQMEELKKKVASIDENEYNTLKEAEERRKLSKDNNSSEFVDLQLEYNKIKAEREASQLKLEEQSNLFNELKAKYDKKEVNSTLSDGFSKLGVSEKFRDVLIKAYAGSAGVTQDDLGNSIVYMNSNEGEKVPASNWLENWSKSTEAQNFIKAQNNSGGNAPGSGSGAGKSIKDMSLDEATAYAKQHGVDAFKSLS